MNAFQIEAIYENGVLKPAAPLPLKEPSKVFLTVEVPESPEIVASEDAERVVRRSQGMLRWMGDAETLHRIAEDAEFDWLER